MFGWIDYSVIGLYLLFSVLIGFRSSRVLAGTEDYFLGNRRQPWFPVAISILAAELSAVSYMGVPGWIYQKDLSYFMLTFMLPVITYLILGLFIPIYQKLRMLSVYEYLEKRYNLFVRLFTSFLFLLLRGGHMATAIYVPSLALQEIASIPLVPSILLIGTAVTLYTLKGGMRAVIWTDFMQFFVLVGGAIMVLLFALSGLNWDIVGAWRLAGSHTKMFDFSLNLKEEITVWGLTFYLAIYYTTTYATDQVIAQRYFTTGSERDTRRALMSSAFITLPVVAILMMIGVVLTAYYKAYPGMSESLSNPDRILPHFAMNVLPSGIKGLLVAGILAATMSTISAGLNSLAAVAMKDFLYRLGLIRQTEGQLFQARIVTLFFGVLITVAAIYVNQLGAVLAVVGKLGSFFMGPICAFFTLGVTSKRVNSGGVIIGGIAGMVTTAWVANFTAISWLWWIVVGFLSSVIIAWTSSLLFKRPDLSRVSAAVMPDSHALESIKS